MNRRHEHSIHLRDDNITYMLLEIPSNRESVVDDSDENPDFYANNHPEHLHISSDEDDEYMLPDSHTDLPTAMFATRCKRYPNAELGSSARALISSALC